jgi:hypothetical protein
MSNAFWARGVSEDKPSTGVFSLDDFEFVYEDCERGIDPDTFGVEGAVDWDCYEQSVTLIGFKELPLDQQLDGARFEPDDQAPYSAIVRHDSNVMQVVRSRWLVQGHYCSPCYPGQVDGDTPGIYLGYAPDPELIGTFGEQSLKDRIFSESDWAARVGEK